MDDLIKRLRARRRFNHNISSECLDHDCQEAADRIAALEAEIEHWKKLHAENCAAYDEAVAGREYYCQQVRATDALEADNARLMGLVETAAAAERARIVAWLRGTVYGDCVEARAFADMIEQGYDE